MQIAEDRLPCIGATMPVLTTIPLVRDPSVVNTFEVDSIDDDGNSALIGQDRIHFTWYEGPADGPLLYQGGDDSHFMQVPDNTLRGETRKVRVEIHDVNSDQIDMKLRGCQNADVCFSAPDSGCFLRMTWTVSYSG